MKYIWDNIDQHLNKEQIKSFLKLDGIDLETSGLVEKIASRKLSYTSLNTIKPDNNILDIGCGLGEDCLELASLAGPNGKVTGIDISNILIKEATNVSIKHKINNVTFQQMDAHQIEFDDNLFDTVCIRRSLQHMVNPRKTLEEALRVLKPLGQLIVIEPDRGSTILNHPDRPMTRRIMTFIEEVVRNPWIGRQLKQLIPIEKISSFSMRLDIDILTNYASINSNFGIETAIKQLINIQMINNEQSEQWLQILKELDRKNQAFCSTTQFIVIATKK